jgi:hypothetical protein
MNTEPETDTEPTPPRANAQANTRAGARAPYKTPVLETHGPWSVNIGLTTSGSGEPPIIPW